MRSIAPAATVAALVLLGACGKHDGNAVSMTNASVDTVANVAKAQQIKLQPGQWDMTVEMVSQEIKGAPAGMPETVAVDSDAISVAEKVPLLVPSTFIPLGIVQCIWVLILPSLMSNLSKTQFFLKSA